MNIYTDGRLRAIGILERPCPMVHGVLVDHGQRNRSTQRWRECDRNGIVDLTWSEEAQDYEYHACHGIAARLDAMTTDYNRAD